MNILKKIFKKKIDINSLELKYESLDNKSNPYQFQKKYYKQEDKLLECFGECNKKPLNKLKLIIITDTHNMLKADKLINLLNEHPYYDACFLLGDHSLEDIEIILKHIDKNKIYALLGNHDYEYIKNYDLFDLNGQVIEINGVKITGIEGSFKYKPADFPSYTQEDSVKFLNNIEKCDILISHDGPFNNNMINNPAHQGLFGITYYLYKNKVKYNIHGHLHSKHENILSNGTKEISLYMVNYLELD